MEISNIKPGNFNADFYFCTRSILSGPSNTDMLQTMNPITDLNSDELVAKRANLERIKEFSKNLQSFNRQTISQQPKLPPAAEKRDIAISEQKFNR